MYSKLSGFIFLKSAFLLAFAISLPSCDKPEEATIISQAGEQREIKLPDGSNITLNAVSTLRYSPGKWDASPYVLLEGEAFSKLKKNKRFIVRSDKGQADLIGATANIYCRDSIFEAKCFDGKVQVSNPDGTQKVLLKAGEQVSVVNGWMKHRQGIAFYPAWQKGESIFKNTPIRQALDELGRQYGVTILADSLTDKPFNGRFGHKDMEKALNGITKSTGLKWEVQGDTVFLRK